MQCPECSSTHIRKNGSRKGKQRYICADCQRQFLSVYEQQIGYSNDFKRECLELYLNGMGFRAIERVKHVHHTTIIYWVKQLGTRLPEAPTEIDILPPLIRSTEYSGGFHRVTSRISWLHEST